MIFKKAT